MEPHIVLQVDTSADHDREVIERLVHESMSKVDAYLRKYITDPVVVVRITCSVRKNDDSSFTGKLHADIDGKLMIFEREKIFKLDNLIQDLFQHMKETLSEK